MYAAPLTPSLYGTFSPDICTDFNNNLALCHDEVRILIFDVPAELEERQRPVMVRSGRGPFEPARAGRARVMHEFSRENLRNPARAARGRHAPVSFRSSRQ